VNTQTPQRHTIRVIDGYICATDRPYDLPRGIPHPSRLCTRSSWYCSWLVLSKVVHLGLLVTMNEVRGNFHRSCAVRARVVFPEDAELLPESRAFYYYHPICFCTKAFNVGTSQGPDLKAHPVPELLLFRRLIPVPMLIDCPLLLHFLNDTSILPLNTNIGLTKNLHSTTLHLRRIIVVLWPIPWPCLITNSERTLLQLSAFLLNPHMLEQS
jgi:hypothetical protein